MGVKAARKCSIVAFILSLVTAVCLREAFLTKSYLWMSFYGKQDHSLLFKYYGHVMRYIIMLCHDSTHLYKCIYAYMLLIHVNIRQSDDLSYMKKFAIRTISIKIAIY